MMSIKFAAYVTLFALTQAVAGQQEQPTEKIAPKADVPQTQPAPLMPPAPGEEARRSEEDEKKREQERLEKEIAAQKAAAEAARLKAEAEKSVFTKLLENSRVYTGIAGGLGLGLNKIHGAGYTVGMSLDYLAYKTYGFHFAAETGQYPAKNGTLNSSGGTVTIATGGSFGFLALDFAAVYAFPVIFGLEPAAGLGISVYQLRGGTYDFSTTVSPLLYGSLYYSLLGNLQVGLITQLTLPFSSQIQSAGSAYSLDSNAALTTLGFKLSLRYAWF
ncbi:MAG: hypothetical protein J0L53_16155 [Spirochaetes bacterium]|nr:hypothetical protein [Spirochaetota bacterium]